MIFVDQDGVLADFNRHYEMLFGRRPTREKGGTDWKLVASVPGFFLTMPMMHDVGTLLAAIHPRPWTVLTGIPSSVNACDNDKRTWIARRFEPVPPVICCRARDKFMHGKPGDTLIDDYPKYRDRWEGMGGIFILHKSSADTARQLERTAP